MRGSPWLWVAVGLVLRCLWPQGFLFRQDEAAHLVDSFAISREGNRPAHAWHSSAGVPNGPGFLYFLAAITSVTTDPLAAQAVIVALNGLALAISVPLFRLCFPAPRDVAAAVAIYATSPVAIWFSRKIWDPCLVPVVAVAATYFATRTLLAPRSWAPIAVFPLLAAAGLIHQSAIFFALAVLAAVAPALLRANRIACAAGALFGAALVFPYATRLANELRQGAVVVVGGSAWPDIDVVTNLLLDATGHNILQAAGLAAGGLLLWPIPPFGLLVQLALAPYAVTFIAGIAELIRPREPAGTLRPVRRVLVWIVLGLPTLYLIARVRGAAHHYVAAWPVLFATMTLGVRRLQASTSNRLRKLVSLDVLVALQAAAWICFQSYMSFQRGSPSYGLPYGDVKAACADVARAARDRGVGDAATPLILQVDVPRDRGPLPRQYRYELEERHHLVVRPPAEGESAHLTLHVSWAPEPFPKSFGRGAWEVRDVT